MKREDAIRRIRELKEQLDRFDVARLRLFGSVSRDEAIEASDLDLIVEFNGPSRYDNYFGVLFLLEDELRVRVDLAEPDTLHPDIRDEVMREALLVA